MKKRVALLLGLICAMVIGLCACGGGGGNSGGGNGGGGSASTFDVGEFTVAVPKGWLVVEQTDMFGEKDADGNYPKRTDYIGIIQGGKTELDAFSKPTIYITYWANSDAASKMESDKGWNLYDEIIDKDPITIDGKECVHYEAKQEAFITEGEFYVYDVVYVPASDSACFQVNVPVDLAGDGGVTVDDADVQAIIASLAIKE